MTQEVKFTTLIATTFNDGTPVPPLFLARWLDAFWRPFGGMSDEGLIRGRWIDTDETEFRDVSMKVSIACDRDRLQEAIRAVRRLGRKLKQRVMYFEVSSYDGVQFLRIE
jgi:hypothetical protein